MRGNTGDYEGTALHGQHHPPRRPDGYSSAVAGSGSDAMASGGRLSTDAELIALGTELDRLRRSCGRLHRQVRSLAGGADRQYEQRGIGPWLPDGRRTRACVRRGPVRGGL
jgi:hypothetical protein